MSDFTNGKMKQFVRENAQEEANMEPGSGSEVAGTSDGAAGTPSAGEMSATEIKSTAESGDGNAVAMDEFDTSEVVPGFTVVNIDPTGVSLFSREYTPSFETVDCVAEIDMLLEYMVRVERQNGITMSFRAYGVDPIVFAKALPAEVLEGAPACVGIPVNGRAATENGSEEIYEMIEVDDALYLSCMSESLNQDYLHQVISEATEEIFTHGKYVYTLVGPRPLAVKGGAQYFIETLKLNSYEMSVLLAYMNGVDGVKIQHGKYGGRTAILFTREV